MKKLFSILAILSIALITANADEQGTVDNCASIIRDFRSMPEKRVPASVLRHAKGLAIMSVVKAGFIFSGKGGKGVVAARTGHGWSGPSFIATGGAGWGPQVGAEVTDFVFVSQIIMPPSVLFRAEEMLPWVLTPVSGLVRWAGMRRLASPRPRRFTVTAEARVFL